MALTFALIVLAVLVVAEVAIRIAAPKLPPPRDWHIWEAQNKVTAMTALAREGGASIVTVGSSMMQAAVDAELLTETVGTDRPVFSGGLNGASMRTVELWTLDVILPALRPELIVVGVQTSELNDNNYGGKRSATLLRRSYGWRSRGGGKTPAARLLLRLEATSYLVRYRRFLLEPTIARRAHPIRFRIGRFRKDPFYLFRRDRGGNTAVSRLGMLDGLLFLREKPYSIRENIRTIWVDQYINDYAAGGPELAALRRTVDGIRAAGAKVLVVLMPATPDWIGLHAGRERDYERFRRVLDSFVSSSGVPFLDPTPEFVSTDLFADPVHLRGTGMKRFAEVLAGPIARLLKDEPAVSHASRDERDEP